MIYKPELLNYQFRKKNPTPNRDRKQQKKKTNFGGNKKKRIHTSYFNGTQCIFYHYCTNNCNDRPPP